MPLHRTPRTLFTLLKSMTRPSTPPEKPASALTNNHQPPSLPNSPLAKRKKASQSPAARAAMDEPTSPSVTKLSSQPPLLVKKLSETASTPTRGSAFAAGYDLYASKATTIPSRGKTLVSTDISLVLPVDQNSTRMICCVAPLISLCSKLGCIKGNVGN